MSTAYSRVATRPSGSKCASGLGRSGDDQNASSAVETSEREIKAKFLLATRAKLEGGYMVDADLYSVHGQEGESISVRVDMHDFSVMKWLFLAAAFPKTV